LVYLDDGSLIGADLSDGDKEHSAELDMDTGFDMVLRPE